MIKITQSLSYGMALLSGALLILVTAIMFVDVVGRYVFNNPLTFAVELVELLMGLALTFGLALTTLRREHIRVDLLTHTGSPTFKKVLDTFSDVATLIFFGIIAWKLFEKGGQTMSDGLYTQILGLPVHPVVYLMSAAAAVALVVSILLLLRPHPTADTSEGEQS